MDISKTTNSRKPSSSSRRPNELQPARLVTGDDLIAAGYAPGPDFSRMLEVAEDAQLEARIQSKEEGLELVRSTFGPPARVS